MNIEQFDLIVNFDLGAILQGGGAIGLAIVAYIALTQWKKQIKLEKQTTLLDQLTDEFHNFMAATSPAITLIHLAKTSFGCNKPQLAEDKEYENSHIIEYINNRGVETSNSILEKLIPLQEALAKMLSLVAKGQSYDIKDYNRAIHAIKTVESIYGQMEAFAYIIKDRNLNWRHPEVQKTLKLADELDVEILKKNLSDQNVEYLSFISGIYKNI
ncbi:MAG: hypothetical protein HF981_24125 [Desulfobacteraceae bacterium]|nr:hypothetical protein [Desulfobacteraceae bacterium]MBC2753504.1 hypothetical protein [Desulfobacteraceae bacterium]